METTVVITGGTRGIGFGLAKEFLTRGCNVSICGRSQSSVDAAILKLETATKGEGQVIGQPCDVSDQNQVQSLWDFTVQKFEIVDVWINNAGLITESTPLWEVDPTTMKSVVDTNITGSLNGCSVAIRGMKAQEGGGHIYNFRGFGSDGSVMTGMVPYGVTKYAVDYLHKGLTKELSDFPDVKVSQITPGIVLTDIVASSQATMSEAEKMFLNILGDTVETVTPWLTEEILKNKRSGAHINWLPTHKIVGRFLMSPFAPKRDLTANSANSSM